MTIRTNLGVVHRLNYNSDESSDNDTDSDSDVEISYVPRHQSRAKALIASQLSISQPQNSNQLVTNNRIPNLSMIPYDPVTLTTTSITAISSVVATTARAVAAIKVSDANLEITIEKASEITHVENNRIDKKKEQLEQIKELAQLQKCKAEDKADRALIKAQANEKLSDIRKKLDSLNQLYLS